MTCFPMYPGGPCGCDKCVAARKCLGGFVNHVTVRAGRVAAICECCGKRARATEANHNGEPDLWQMPQGWSEAPYPKDFKHDDGSVGTTFTCPTCNKRLRAGEALRTRAGGWVKEIV